MEKWAATPRLAENFVPFLCLYTYPMYASLFPPPPSILILLVGAIDLSLAIYARYISTDGTDSSVGYAAHLGGAAAGFLVGMNVLRNFKTMVRRRKRIYVLLGTQAWFLSHTNYTVLLVHGNSQFLTLLLWTYCGALFRALRDLGLGRVAASGLVPGVVSGHRRGRAGQRPGRGRPLPSLRLRGHPRLRLLPGMRGRQERLTDRGQNKQWCKRHFHPFLVTPCNKVDENEETQPPKVVCKMEALFGYMYIHIAYTFLLVWRLFVCKVGA